MKIKVFELSDNTFNDNVKFFDFTVGEFEPTLENAFAVFDELKKQNKFRGRRFIVIFGGKVFYFSKRKSNKNAYFKVYELEFPNANFL